MISNDQGLVDHDNSNGSKRTVLRDGTCFSQFEISNWDCCPCKKVRPLRLFSLCVASGLIGASCAWLIQGIHHRQFNVSESIATLIPEPEPPPPPSPPRDQIRQLLTKQELDLTRPDGTSIRIGYTSAVIDPRWITFEFFGGWNRELEANTDQDALLFTSGPTFARGQGNGELGMLLHGDLLLGNGLWTAGNRAAAKARAWVGITKQGRLEFGYGDLDPTLKQQLRVFIGGLHAFTNTTRPAPTTYEGVYGEMRLADVRIIYGLRPDGMLELVETADGVLFSDLKRFVDKKGFLAAYLPDHASKSRLIVPGQRHWDEDHAVWVSGGKPSITQMPFLLRVIPSAEWHDRQPTALNHSERTN